MDLDALKKKPPAIDNCFDAGNNQVPFELECYNEGWNACIDHLANTGRLR